VKSDSRGDVDLNDLKEKMTPDVAGLMLTNPNTLGLFDKNIIEICKIVHEKGGLVYCDGANMNAIMGITKPAEAGFDVMHLNLHKTFSTPHGGGGPGSGPVGVVEKLIPFLPAPLVEKKGENYSFDYNSKDSIGKVKGFYGNFGVLVRAYTYIKSAGNMGLKNISENAVLNANYILARLKGHYKVAYDRHCMHECVLSDEGLPNEVTTIDVAKRLLDYGYHAPTIYFPLIVHGAIMIEPTETESKETIDEFIDVMIKISEEAKTNPEVVKTAPHTTPVRRLDAVKAAREPKLIWRPDN
jgi:glycine dehydrogenase subunit 2